MNTVRNNRQGRIPGGLIWFPLLFCLIGYSVLNRGFAYIGYSPFFIGEFTLLFYLLSLNHGIYFPKFLGTNAGKIWFAFFTYNLVIFFISATHGPSESIRNSVIWVYTLFFYIGYYYGKKLIDAEAIGRFENILLFISLAMILSNLLYPLNEYLKEATSFLYNGEALLGNASTVHALFIGFVFYLFFVKKLAFRALWISLGFFTMVIFVQSRAAMLGVLAVMIYVFLFDNYRYFLKRAKVALIILVLIGTAYFASGITLKGHRGEASSSSIKDSIYSIFTESSDASLQGPREDRLNWWTDVLKRTCSSATTFMFGLGFDEILNDRMDTPSTIIRYPHNSFLSVFGFTGIVGLSLYLSLAAIIFLKIYKSSRSGNEIPVLRWYPIFAIGYFVSAFFSTVFEAPFHSYVFWVLSGIFYGIAVHKDLAGGFRAGPVVSG